MALLDNIAAYWKFDDNAEDAVGSLDLTLSGSPSYATGKINNGLDLERGSSQYAYIDDTASLEPGSDFSIFAWIKQESASTGEARVIASKGTSTGNQRCMVFKISDATSLALQASSAGTSFDGDVSVAWTEVVGTFVHIGVTFDSNQVKFYVNGSQQGTTQTSGIATLFNGTGRFGFGAENISGTPGDFFDGIIDEAGFWNRALTADEITRLYNSGTGLSHPFTVAFTATIALETATLTEAYTEVTGYTTAPAETMTLTESLSAKYGWVNQDKSATSSFTNESKS